MARKPIIGRNFTGAATSTTATNSDTPADTTVTGGIAGGIAAAAAASGPSVRKVEVSTLIPHPLNDPSRSQPGVGPKWDEIVQSIKSRGVESPAKAVTRAAFVKARPDYADVLPKDGSYVLVFGHRRRAAAIAAGVKTMPIIIEDTLLEDNGDLDAMAVENLGREDLTPIAQAELFARYVDDLNLTQGDIAKRLGVDQATISRRLSLLLLTEQSAAAVESGQLSPSAAATLGSGLPYGPVRKWQRSRREAEQITPQRREDQNTALSRILAKDGTVQKIVEFVLAERAARTEAGERGITIVGDPDAALGGPTREITDPTAADGEIVGSIDSITGALLLWELAPAPSASAVSPATDNVADDAADEPAEPAAEPSEPTNDDKPAKAPQKQPQSPAEPSKGSKGPAGDSSGGEAARAASARLGACEIAAASTPSKPHMAEILAQAIAHGIDTTSNRVVARADTWATGTGEAADNYAATAAVAWRRVLAGYERSVETAGTTWGPVQQTYIELLANRASYKPSALERRLMQRA